MKFEIFEGNIERLDKKLERICKKAMKYGNPFHYEKVGEVFRNIGTKEKPEIAKFIVVDVSGEAKVNGWIFVATIEHTENGNVIRKNLYDIEVPERYYTCKPVCDHCGTNRARKDTYIIYNEETKEFKQVGKSCLNEFTNGMSAELYAQYVAAYDELIEGEAVDQAHFRPYLNTKEFLLYSAETYKHYGYRKASDPESTVSKTWDFYLCDRGKLINAVADHVRREMKRINFNKDNQSEYVAKALEWLQGQEETSEYIHNLKVTCLAEYTEARNAGIICSLFVAYDRAIEKEIKWAKRQKENANSEWIGKEGERIEVEVKEAKTLTSYETQFGDVYIYQFKTIDGNVIIWKTSKWFKWFDEDFKFSRIKGTVKAHGEFRNVKQTELTRCKLF